MVRARTAHHRCGTSLFRDRMPFVQLRTRLASKAIPGAVVVSAALVPGIALVGMAQRAIYEDPRVLSFMVRSGLASSPLVAITAQYLGTLLLFAVVVFLLRTRASEMRIFSERSRTTTLIGAAALTALVSVLLAVAGLAPWTFLSPSNGSARFGQVVVNVGDVATLVLWAILACVVVPVMEEVAFRFGLLQLVRTTTGSARVAVLASAVVFALGHVRPGDPIANKNAAATLVLGLILGRQAVDQPKRFDLLVVVHSARNLTELFALVFYALKYG